MSLGTRISDTELGLLDGVEVTTKVRRKTFYIPYPVAHQWIVITTPEGRKFHVDADAIFEGVGEE